MSWQLDRGSAGPRHRRRRVPLTIRLSIAVVLAIALAIGTSYTLRTLNL